MSDDILTAKSVAMCVLFIASLTLGTLPILLSKLFRWNTDARKNPYVEKLLCLGAGVLLCTTFMHMLPEVSDKLTSIKVIQIDQDIHYPELLMCAGFFIMYFVEESVHACLNPHKKAPQTIENCSEEPKPITVCVENNKHHEEHSHSHFLEEPTAMKSIRSLFIVLGLSVHELFEGLAVGLESSASNVWYMFGAVSAHKFVIAFCIGVELLSSGIKTKFVIMYVFIFAVVSPVGIGIGLMITSDEEAADIPAVFLQGLASGTLLYVVFFEILNAERRSGLKQFFAILIGFLIMFTIKMLEK